MDFLDAGTALDPAFLAEDAGGPVDEERGVADFLEDDAGTSFCPASLVDDGGADAGALLFDDGAAGRDDRVILLSSTAAACGRLVRRSREVRSRRVRSVLSCSSAFFRVGVLGRLLRRVMEPRSAPFCAPGLAFGFTAPFVASFGGVTFGLTGSLVCRVGIAGSA